MTVPRTLLASLTMIFFVARSCSRPVTTVQGRTAKNGSLRFLGKFSLEGADYGDLVLNNPAKVL